MLWILSLLLSLVAASAAGETIRIDDVEVEISAPNPVEARERAFMEARRAGYRLALEAAGQSVPARVSDDQVNAAVTAIEVMSERQSANRYSARFSLFVEVADPAGRQIAPPAPPPEGPIPPPTAARRGAWIYVIPAERAEGRIDRIWRRDTAWTQSFRAVGPIAGQSPLTPSGDEDDRALVAPARLAASDPGALAGLSQRHNAPVAAAILDRGPPTRAGRSDGPIRAVEVIYWSRTDGGQTLRHVFAERPELTTANAIVQALLEQIISPPPPAPAVSVQAPAPASAPAPTSLPAPAPEEPSPVAPAVASPVVASTPVEEPPPQTIQPFAYDFADIDDWRRIRARLAAIPGLSVAPTTITTGRIIGQLRYAGAPEPLAAQLAAAGLGQARSAPAAPSPPAPAPSSAAPGVPPVAPATTGETETGPFAAHLISTRSEAEAVTEWGRLNQRFPDILAGRTPIYRSVDLGADRGVWWRLGAGGFASRREAEAWCARLAAFNQYCRIAVN
jgi:hypothetical protein